jgi:DNA-binding transcriptional LysR family regulator
MTDGVGAPAGAAAGAAGPGGAAAAIGRAAVAIAAFRGSNAGVNRISRPLNVRQLEAFRAVMLTGSMTAAGRLLSVTQPAVTRLVRDLEAELNLTLFRRDGIQITPTREAKELYREVERHFVSTERIREAAIAIREYSAGQLRVAAILAMSNACMPRAVSRFLTSYPNVVISVHNGASLDILDLVVNGSVDIGIVAVPPGRSDLVRESAPEAEVVCLVPRDHPLAGHAEITAADLHEQDFVALAPGSLMRLELNAVLHLAGSHPRVRVESLFSSTVAGYVNQGLGLAVVDPLTAVLADPERTVVRAFRPRIRYALDVVYPRHADRPPPLQDFAATLLACYQEEIATTRRLTEMG